MANGAVPASERRLARVRKIYDAIVVGDPAQAMAGTADEIEWRNPADAVEPGTRRGRTEFADALSALMAQFDFDRLEILSAAERGETVALTVRVVATGRGSGAPIDAVFGQIFTFDGDRVVGFEWSRDPGAALRAVDADLDSPG